MRELIIRRSIYNSNIAHKLYETENEGEWEYKTPESWMPVYFTHDKDYILALDGEGFGHSLCLGEEVYGLPGDNDECVFETPLKVSKIFLKDNHVIVKLV